MKLVDKFMSLSRLKQIIICSVTVVVVVAVVIGIVLNRNKYTATTMRLLNVEGTVNIEDSNGNSRPVKGNMRFQSGDAMNTGADGIASVGLDETKIITLQNDSRAEFTKSGKHLELKLTKGAVFFNVTEKLKPDETFEIKTSTMTAGIRGTSGIVYYAVEDDGKETIVVTDGVVALSATNQITGETKTMEVSGGEEAQVTYYDDRKTDSVEFSNNKVNARDLDDFALRNIGKDKKLVKRIANDTGWDQGGLEDAIKDAEERQKAPTPIVTLSPTPIPTVTPSSTPTITPKPTLPPATPTPPSTPTPSPTPTPEPTISPSPMAKPKPTATRRPTTSPTPSPRPTATNTPTTSPTATSTPTATPTVTTRPTTRPTATITPTTRPTATNTPTNTPTPTSTPIPTPVEPDYSYVPTDADFVSDGVGTYGKYGEGRVWGTTYNGHPVYIRYYKVPNDNGGETYTYSAPINGKWVPLHYKSVSPIVYAFNYGDKEITYYAD
ncbi:FecR family protein [Ruminococcaceae bacterium R-25]|nr:FecR family protein [Ruminococcaceae bacterium R-25]SUQ11831.1 FecR family protein [Oscillospiraceae bacterium]